MSEKIKVTTGSVQETLLMPLWGRAYETRRNNPRLIDRKAVEIVNGIDYDFTEIEKTQAMSQHSWVARSLHTDRLAGEFMAEYPDATIVNIGCGMDTTFSRIDNGRILFYELDLPDVIDLRKNFHAESDRHRNIASSFLETEWFDEVDVRDGLLFLAGGVFCYFTEDEIRGFFKKTADRFRKCDLYFDSLSSLGLKIAKKQVLKKGGMGMSMDGGWGIKPVSNIEKWDSRFRVVNSHSMSRGMFKGLPFGMRLVFLIPEILGVASMVHVRIE